MKQIILIMFLLASLPVLTGMNGDISDIYKCLAERYTKEGKMDEALKCLEHSIEHARDPAPILVDRAFVYLKMGKRDLAVADFTRAIELKPEVTSVYVSRGLVYLDMKDEAKANADFRKACDLGDQSGCDFLKKPAEGRD